MCYFNALKFVGLLTFRMQENIMPLAIIDVLQMLSQLRQILVAVGETDYISLPEHNLFIERFDELSQLLKDDTEDSQYLGQEIMSQIFQRYPQIAHLIPRELLWFFGGDCLHYMPDEEIMLLQQLDELKFEAEQQGKSFDWYATKQQLLKKKNNHFD